MNKITKHIDVQIYVPVNRNFNYFKECLPKKTDLIPEIKLELLSIREKDKIFILRLHTDDTQYVEILLKHIDSMLGYGCCNYHEATLYTNTSYIKNGIKVRETKGEVIDKTIKGDATAKKFGIEKRETNAITLKDWNNRLKSVIELLSDLDEDYMVDIMVMDEPNGCLVREVEFDIDICHPIRYVTIYIRYKQI